MKNIQFWIFVVLLFAFTRLAGQVPTLKPGINLQGLARDKDNIPAANSTIHVLTELFAADTLRNSSLTEEFITKTDEVGIFQIALGKGKRVGGVYGSLFDIPWSTLNYWVRIKIAVEPQPLPLNWNYQDEWVNLGAALLEMVPYALYSLSSNESVLIKSKNRSELLQQADSFIIQLTAPLEVNDGISVLLEASSMPMPAPIHYIFRDLFHNRVIVYFTAPFTGFITWVILD